MTERDDLRVELAGVATELAQAPADDFALRSRLRSRQQDLRAQVEALPIEGDPATLRARADKLEVQIRKAIDGRIPPASIGGGSEASGGGIHPYEALEMNRQIDESNGLEALKTELSAVRRQLDKVEAQQPTD